MVNTRSGNCSGEGDSAKSGTSKEQKEHSLKEVYPKKDMDESKELRDNHLFLRSFAYFDDKTSTDILNDDYGQLARGADRARKTGTFCDITLIVGPDKYKINGHRLVLATAFDYFQAMLTSNLKEGSQAEVELPNTDAKTMESLIDFAYTGNIKVNMENIESITTAANFFGMTSLLEKCVGYVRGKINKGNCIEILEFAEHISDKELKDFAMSYVTKNLKAVATENLDIVRMTTSLLLEIIGANSLSVHDHPGRNEMKLFQIGLEQFICKI